MFILNSRKQRHEKTMPDVFEASGMAEDSSEFSAGRGYFVFTGVLKFGPK